MSKTGVNGFSTPSFTRTRREIANDNSAYNLAILRHMALNFCHLAAWKDEFLAELLSPI
ncbi:MAG: hypothetical protein JOZ11_10275 [Alphaproteobacteria bacterium]|nr:hypothetical protein [Alphaproteobacteria bacterium]